MSMSAMPVARMSGASKSYRANLALDDVDLAVSAGEVVAILGPNGAGKTTAVRLLMGLIRADAGRCELFGQDPRSALARVRVGAMLQVSGVPETLTVRELIRSFSAYYPAPRTVSGTLELCGLQELADRRVQRLSGGQRQRALFGLAICGAPELLFLDEPTVGLDVAARRDFHRILRTLVAAGTSVVLTTHYLEEADAVADRIVVLKRGRVLAEGTPDVIKGSVPDTTIRCRSTLTGDQIAALPGTLQSRTKAGFVEIIAARPEATLRALLAADPAVSGLEVRRAGLEDAFLSLTDGRRAA